MPTRLVEFDGRKRYEAWLRRVGDRVRIVSVSTARRRWSPLTGFFTNQLTYSVTYTDDGSPEVAKSMPGARTHPAVYLVILGAAAAAVYWWLTHARP